MAALSTRAGAATPERSSFPAGNTAGVELLVADPDLALGLPKGQLAEASRALVVPRVELDAGAWRPPESSAWAAPVTGLLVLEGLLARDVSLGGRVCTLLLGPGDIFSPWPDPDELLACKASWTAVERSAVAVLDGHYAVGARRWPTVAVAVQRRLCAQANRLATHVAISQLPGVEQRILAAFWQLAERFGRVSGDGVAVPLLLTHQAIGQIAGAQRPTVTLALGNLAASGSLTRCADRTWLLAHDSRAGL